jgi:hypothetical protein
VSEVKEVKEVKENPNREREGLEEGLLAWRKHFGGAMRQGDLGELFGREPPAKEPPAKEASNHSMRVAKSERHEESERGRKKADAKSLNGQQYIMDNVLPVIAECFLEMSQNRDQFHDAVDEFIRRLKAKGESFRIVDPFSTS